ncbi:MAG: hypothetical protein ACXW32_10980 [Limisphaerales bacterium]
MKPYLDGGFLLVLLTRTPGTSMASTILRKISPPIPIHFLHQLQAENLLIRFQRDSNPDLQTNGNEGLRLWNHYLHEGVFSITAVDWESAFRNAITWSRLHPSAPPSPWLLLYPAIAVTAGATHFCSFDPRSREVARTHGLQLLPREL